MPATVGPILAAVKALIEGDSALAAKLAQRPAGYGGGPAVYDEGDAPNAAAMPYVLVEAPTDVPYGNFRNFGGNCTLQIKSVTQVRGTDATDVIGMLQVLFYKGRPITVAGFESSWCDEFVVQTPFHSTLAGAVAKEWPGILRVYAT